MGNGLVKRHWRNDVEGCPQELEHDECLDWEPCRQKSVQTHASAEDATITALPISTELPVTTTAIAATATGRAIQNFPWLTWNVDRTEEVTSTVLPDGRNNDLAPTAAAAEEYDMLAN
jgi:hypothetical protein